MHRGDGLFTCRTRPKIATLGESKPASLKALQRAKEILSPRAQKRGGIAIVRVAVSGGSVGEETVSSRLRRRVEVSLWSDDIAWEKCILLS